MKFIETRLRLPPQGKKVLYFTQGDTYVVQRFGNHWFPIPFTDSAFSQLDPPEFWADIELPEPYQGKMRLMVDGRLREIDEVEKEYPELYKEFIQAIVETINVSRHQDLKKYDKACQRADQNPKEELQKQTKNGSKE